MTKRMKITKMITDHDENNIMRRMIVIIKTDDSKEYENYDYDIKRR